MLLRGGTRSIALTVAALLAGAGCARPAPPPPETPARVKDSAPDKIAAQRAALPGLDLEQEDQRWGVEAARERKQAAPPETPGSAPAATGASQPQPPKPADVRKPQAPASPTP
jgi:hypothetical protein